MERENCTDKYCDLIYTCAGMKLSSLCSKPAFHTLLCDSAVADHIFAVERAPRQALPRRCWRKTAKLEEEGQAPSPPLPAAGSGILTKLLHPGSCRGSARGSCRTQSAVFPVRPELLSLHPLGSHLCSGSGFQCWGAFPHNTQDSIASASSFCFQAPGGYGCFLHLLLP